MNRFTIRDIAQAGLVAALYAVLSLAFAPISFGVYQVRVAEALTVLPFFLPAAIPGLYVGCLLANVFGNVGWVDIVVGPLITLVAAIVTRQAGALSRSAALPPAILPIVLMWLGGVYLLSGFSLSLRTVLGALLAATAVLPLLISRSRRDIAVGDLREQIGTRFVVSLILALVAVILLRVTTDTYFIVCGALLMVAAVAAAGVFSWSAISEIGPAVLLAPLPPVVLNALGVSAYLAPIIGVDYWFCVQMVGVGELIACYVLGLPLLVLLRRRNIIPSSVF